MVSISLLPVCLFLFALPVWAQPRISFDRLHAYFGEASEGRPVLSRFTFMNNGDRPLLIKGFRTG